MINFSFDGFGQYEIPTMILCNPDRTELFVIGESTAPEYDINLMSCNEIRFVVYDKWENKETGKYEGVEYYDAIKKNRLIRMSNDFSGDEIEQIEWFVIDSITEVFEGFVAQKQVVCYSYEFVLNRKNANFLDGTYKFYDLLNPEGTLLQKIVDISPSWKIGHVDTALMNKYRTFDGVNESIYGFMYGDCMEAYDCIFTFDTDKMLINAYDTTAFIKQSNLIMTFDNLIKAVEIETSSDPIITALSVIGGGDIDIHDVNPTGDNFIYSFDYYIDNDLINEELSDAIRAWEAVLDNNRPYFSDTLTELKTAKAILTTLEGELNTLNSELKAIDEVRTVQIEFQGIQSETAAAYDAKKIDADVKQSEVNEQNSFIQGINTRLTDIVAVCKISNNFTVEQLEVLDLIVQEGEYANENYIKTSIMNYVEQQEIVEQLYAKGLQVADINKAPRMLFTLDSTNVLFQEDFKEYFSEIIPGFSFNIEIKEDYWAYPVLLEIHLDYNNPTDFEMVFGTSLRLSTASKDISTEIGEAISASQKVSMQSSIWDTPVKSGFMDKATQYMTESLNLANQEVINSDNVTVSIGPYGIRTRRQLEDGTYDPRQLWLTGSTLAMTDDNWESSKLAIGIIGGKAMVNAEVLAGQIVVTNELQLHNESGSFVVDSGGARMTNLSLALTNESNTQRIMMDPNTGIKIQTKTNGVGDYMDKFYIDTSGNLVIDGRIIANAGTIAGWEIATDRLRNTANGDYIGSNGYGKLSLLNWTPNSATFNGNIYAKNLDYKGITYDKYGDSSIGTASYQNGSVTPGKLDRVYADIGSFNSLNANVANLGNLVATKASIAQLNSVNAKIDNLMAGKIVADMILSTNLSTRGESGNFIGENIDIGGSNRLIVANGQYGTLMLMGRNVSWKTISVRNENDTGSINLTYLG